MPSLVPDISPKPSPAAPAAPVPSLSPVLPAASPPAPSVVQSGLRVSNQTDYPIRVALLPRQPASAAGKTSYSQPVHWDFAPSEGKLRGLSLSLPDGTLKIQAGDVLVAFAQDGSRRYWGPYVVGQTSLPVWTASTQEWQLNLQP